MTDTTNGRPDLLNGLLDAVREAAASAQAKAPEGIPTPQDLFETLSGLLPEGVTVRKVDMSDFQGEEGAVFDPLKFASEDLDDSVVPDAAVLKDGNDLRMVFDLPGAAADSLNIEIEDDLVTVSAVRPRPTGELISCGHGVEEIRYERTMPLPETPAEEDISATYRDGVLEITFTGVFTKPEPIRVKVA